MVARKKEFKDVFDLESQEFSDAEENTYKVIYYEEGFEIEFINADNEEKTISPFYEIEGILSPITIEYVLLKHHETKQFPEP